MVKGLHQLHFSAFIRHIEALATIYCSFEEPIHIGSFKLTISSIGFLYMINDNNYIRE